MNAESNGEAGAPGEALVVLIPLYNDWESLGLLLADLDRVLDGAGLRADVLVVDDDSTAAPGDDLRRRGYAALGRVDVLTLRRNLGHQRAIAVGLAYVEAHRDVEAVVVMDGDGEDDPRDVPRLLARARAEGGNAIVFAERTKRSESWLFVVCYHLYRQLHYLLTGYAVRVGNFSVVPRRRLESLVAVSELWVHYAAAAFRSRQPYRTVPTHRARRLRGRSSMNFISLVAHGLSAISLYSELIGVRLLVANAALIGLTFLGIGAIVYVRLLTHLAVPGWATYSAGLLAVVLLQSLTLTLMFCFFILSGRPSASFLPRRDHGHFVRGVAPLGEPAGRRPVPTEGHRE